MSVLHGQRKIVFKQVKKLHTNVEKFDKMNVKVSERYVRKQHEIEVDRWIFGLRLVLKFSLKSLTLSF
jgi:hypothetical protein